MGFGEVSHSTCAMLKEPNSAPTALTTSARLLRGRTHAPSSLPLSRGARRRARVTWGRREGVKKEGNEVGSEKGRTLSKSYYGERVRKGGGEEEKIKDKEVNQATKRDKNSENLTQNSATKIKRGTRALEAWSKKGKSRVDGVSLWTGAWACGWW